MRGSISAMRTASSRLVVPMMLTSGHTLKATNVFDPDNNQWLSAPDKPPDMTYARWYPTTLTLPENKGVITFSGDGSEDKIEVYDLHDWRTSLPNVDKP